MNFNNNNGMKSFNLKDLINIENIPKDILENIANNTPIDLGIDDIEKENKETTIDTGNKETTIDTGNNTIEEESKSTSIEDENNIISEEDRLKNLEILKKKLHNKEEELRNSRKSKNQKEDGRIKMLKENPLFKNLGSLNTPEAKKMIDNIASKMCNDPKQKKAMKKQMEKLINKMDSINL
jgi:hypothetical protein